MLTNAPRGTKDIYGSYMNTWKKLEDTVNEICTNFGFNEIRTPIFEHTELFQRGVGETTDIVQKEMYSFTDKGDRNITLKPEGTAGVVRAYLERKMYADAQPTKLFYITPAFRYERPQAGRYRQFHQFGVELFGSDKPSADAEVIALAANMLKNLGITNVELHINSLGGPECRKKYNNTLKEFLSKNIDSLCPTCLERYEKNPLRILDCKNENCQAVLKDAPLAKDELDTECKEHFEELLSLLDAMEIEYVVDPWIVRGLDYYTRTVFEFISKDIGAQGTVCGGGRYDKLIEECGGSPTPAVGFGAGIERLIMTMEAINGANEDKPTRDIYLGYVGENAKKTTFALVNELRNNNISVETDLMSRSVKAQMKYANKIGARYSAIIGDNELEENSVRIKNMETREQIDLNIEEIVKYMKENK
ncbi:histidine--tRNA ligase [Vallitalea guaymasensis]|uniref:Histidine--tRNA ligase n=1 Tax=Vallitalea guaymasensis TaxID=1185412 RepID=A0A8J8SDU1_9FIRM|nr:histidine--tRNA ligase [Vallitalea guaymasensis]QUH31208.1 histidine--tRNA ligase [Vallitalea guaymasensis]